MPSPSKNRLQRRPGERLPGEKGTTLLLFLFSLLPIIGFAGLVSDMGWYYYTSETAISAAEAASTAAVRTAMDYATAGATYTCAGTSTGMQCQQPTACGSTSGTLTNNLQAACAYAGANGFSNGGLNGRQTVTIEANTTSPAPTVAGVTVLYWATARITQTNPAFFVGVLGITAPRVSVRSTAAVVNLAPNTCVASLNATASGAISIGGTSNVALTNCSVQVNSNAGTALSMNGSACLSATAIQVVGGASTTGCTTPSATTSANAMGDPFFAVAPPSVPTTCDQNNYKITSGKSVTLQPGTYCGGMTINSGTVTLNPGTYILKGGGLSCSAGCNLSGSGVTFYNTCNSGSCGGGNSGYSPVNIGGNGSVNLSAPTSGSLSGLLFFQDRSVSPKTSQNESILGGSSAQVNGVMYFPKSTVKFAGNFSGANSSSFLIADQITFSGSSNLQITPTGPPPAWAPTAALLE
ncbi:MAG TPA: hypothetical protein VH351_07285 [Bryobacteraceae bacterium]|jgi:hypothetical protein|nr:hypothetical protein [Bryobacteraceae bacterium]